MAFDRYTPQCDPGKADFPAPIEGRNDSGGRADMESAVNFWVSNKMPRAKIVVGIPTFARTWKVSHTSRTTGVPPLTTEGPGAAGPLTKTPGILSYGEVCSRLRRKSVGRVRKLRDPTQIDGRYGHLPYDPLNETDGIWIGYEDPDTAGIKAFWAKAIGLGGVAIVDLSTDDFTASCTPDSFPIVRAINFEFR